MTVIPIINRSAAEFWLGSASVLSSNELVTFPEKFDFTETAAEDFSYVAGCLGLTLPIETFSYEERNQRSGKCCHVKTRNKPYSENAFAHFKINKYDIFVAGPELTFLQAARYLDFAHLVYLGIRLCAQYYIQKETGTALQKNAAQMKRDPVTSAERIRHFLDAADGERGVKLARRAIRYVIDAANSPMESALGALMILPPEYGGLGMPAFTMNEPLKLSDKARAHYQVDALRGDFYWRERKTIAEYNSNAFHMDAAQQVRDADRINAFQQSGYRVIPITYGNLRFFSSFESFAVYLMEELGCPQLKVNLQEKRETRKLLCNELLGTKI